MVKTIKRATKPTKKAFIAWLNELGAPEHDHPENGGRVPWFVVRNNTYGRWLKRNDPIAFNLGFQEWQREYHENL